MSSREDLTAGSKPISASHRKGSQGNLLKSAAGSKAGSLKNLAGKTGQDVPQTLGNPNAIVYENTYKTKPDKK